MSLTSATEPSSSSPLVIVYDGDCPFCATYVNFLRLNAAAGAPVFVNAREGGEYVDEIRALNMDLDEGMVVRLGANWYHGADAIHALALLTTPSGVFNRVTAWSFRSKGRARVMYPILRRGRNLALFLLGRRRINR